VYFKNNKRIINYSPSSCAHIRQWLDFSKNMLHDSLNGGEKNTRKNIIFLLIVKKIDKKDWVIIYF
jgi:hypothetical protein